MLEKTYFIVIWERLILKSKIFSCGVSFRNVSFCYYEQKYMCPLKYTFSLKFLNVWIKLSFENTPGNKNLSKVTTKNTTKLLQLMPLSIFIISLKHVSVVYDGVCFYQRFRILLKMAMKESVMESVLALSCGGVCF